MRCCDIHHREAGLTLIELMIAMVLGLLVAGGIVTIFLSTSASTRVQNQLALVQEEGRYAISRITDDLRMANGQYCTNTGGIAASTASGVYLDGLRAPLVQAKNLVGAMSDVTTRWGQTSGGNTYPAMPASPYYFPSFLSMRGYDCDSHACKPVNPGTDVVPAMGKAVGSRVLGTSVLTLRYVDSTRGWALGGTSYVVGDSTITAIHLTPKAGEPALTDLLPGHLAMLADCSGAQIFAVNVNGGDLAPDGLSNFSAPVSRSPQSAPKLFDFNTDYLTVTYYVKVVANDDGTTTGALVRKGKDTDELVRGVERLDFLYGIEDANGYTRYLSADDIDSSAGGHIACPPTVPTPLGTDPGCLWRAVKSIEVRLLMTGQQALYTLAPNEQRYVYAIDGITSPAAPDAAGRKITPAAQGFVNQKMRREFSALVSVRNYNP